MNLPCNRYHCLAMISIELWRARLGMFNCSQSSLSRSAFRGDHQPATNSLLKVADSRDRLKLPSSAQCDSHLSKMCALFLLLEHVAVTAHLVLLLAGDIEKNPGPISKGKIIRFVLILICSSTF